MPWVAWALSEEGTPLPRHPDARLTPRGRALPCERVGGGMRVSDAAAMAGEPGLPVGRARRAARGPRDGARAREAPRPLAERQGRAHEQDARAGVAVREGAGERGGQGLRPRPFLEHYNRNRPHGACGGLPSMSRITGANNVLAHNT